MKILRSALELAEQAGEDDGSNLRLVGRDGVITDVAVGFFEDYERCMIPVGLHCYGKVITEQDPFRGPGLNLVRKGSHWRFVDDYGAEVPVEVVETMAGTKQ